MSGKGGPDPAFPPSFTIVPHPELLSVHRYPEKHFFPNPLLSSNFGESRFSGSSIPLTFTETRTLFGQILDPENTFLDPVRTLRHKCLIKSIAQKRMINNALT